jgi:hypothetical protein
MASWPSFSPSIAEVVFAEADFPDPDHVAQCGLLTPYPIFLFSQSVGSGLKTYWQVIKVLVELKERNLFSEM